MPVLHGTLQKHCCFILDWSTFKACSRCLSPVHYKRQVELNLTSDGVFYKNLTHNKHEEVTTHFTILDLGFAVVYVTPASGSVCSIVYIML